MKNGVLFADSIRKVRAEKQYYQIRQWVGRRLPDGAMNSRSWEAYSQAVDMIRAQAGVAGVDVGLAVQAVAELIKV